MVLMVLMICFLAAPLLSQSILLEEIQIADPSESTISQPTSVLLKNGLIAAIGEEAQASVTEDTRVLNSRGRFLIPGLSDMHVHLDRFGESAPPLLIANGVTLVRDMGGDPATLESLREKIRDGQLVGPQIQYAGPAFESRAWLTAVRGVFKTPIDFRLPFDTAHEAREWVELLAPLKTDLIKIRNFPNLAAYQGLLEAASEEGLEVGGHASWQWPLVESVRAGQRSFEHLPLLSFNPTEAIDEAREELAKEILAQGAYIVPTIIAMQGRLVDIEGLRERLEHKDPRRALIPTEVVQGWYDEVEERESEGSNLDWPTLVRQSTEHLRALHSAGTPMVTATDLAVAHVYPGSSVHEELAFLVRDVGMTPREALLASTLHAASLAGLAEEIGRVEVGYRANLVVLDANPFEAIENVSKIHAVVAEGQYLDRAKLEGLKSSVAAHKDDIPSFRYPTAWIAHVQSDPESTNVERLASYYLVQGDYVSASKLYRQARVLDPANPRLNTGVLVSLINELYQPDPQYPLEELWTEAEPSLKRLDSDPDRTFDLLVRLASVAHAHQDTDLRYGDRVAAIDPKGLSQSQAQLFHQLMSQHYLSDRVAPSKALEHRIALQPENWEENAQALNNLAWWCFENRVELERAQQLAEDSIEKAESDASRANSLDTLAEIVALDGDTEEAARLIRQAIELNPTDYFKSQLARFLEASTSEAATE